MLYSHDKHFPSATELENRCSEVSSKGYRYLQVGLWEGIAIAQLTG